ncbi:hypothetical protein SUGI_1004680 [Cryptomeria japonica]|uniref:disease resistance protein TAO1-like n=1 Tax=Cryptomeria japonica TaxID=3369 RepID=UPI00241499AC|nr:disease resistance protein TAO1-like [Cryptomeria japonica]GLJ47578.1 hypothetical protein SUGI_1004680 [Cryptomeria japonica]
MVEYLKSWLLEGAEGEISERMVDFVYHRLDASCKEAFLDIVFFFCNWERCMVAFGVGEMEFQELERSALVNVTDEGEVNVHDIVKARGRMLSLEGERITDLESLTDVLQDAQRIKKTKGIFLSENFELEARHLNLMKRSLRVLILIESTRIVNGECEGAFEHLRLVSIDNHDNYSRMNVSKHPKLTALIVRYDEDSNFPEVSGVTSSLKYMCIESSTLVNLVTTLSQLQSLRSLTLQNCRGFDSLPQNIGNLPFLGKLDLSSCSSLTSLSDDFDNLSSLENLDLSYCPSLISLPDSFGNLSSLNQLDLQSCSSLISLPDSFGNLSSLNRLYLTSCSSLISLPDSFGNLSSLNRLYLPSCSSLISLPDSFGNLSSLNQLELQSCSSLISLPDNFGSLSDLVELRLDACTELSVLPESFGNLGSLEKLILTHCDELSNLPQNFGQLKCLKYVSIYGCFKLQTLSSDFECLSSLVAVDASCCFQLEENAMDKLAMMKGLMFVGINGSPMLKMRWDQVKDQYSLVVRQGLRLGADRDVMHRAFFHSESKFLHVDENGQFAESPRPAAGVILCVLLTVCDLTSPSNSRYLEAVKRKWMEVKSASVEMMMMILVEVGSSWDESEGRVTEILPHLPRDTTAWIAPDNRARLLFAYSLFKVLRDEYNYNKMCDVIVSMLTSVDEEGRMKMQLLNDHYTPDFEYQDSWEKLFSPIFEASNFF